MHLCGRCKATFADIAEFFNHKKLCKEQSKKNINNIILPERNRAENQNDFNLATDEAAVISLLANQLSSQNTQPRPNDDLDHLTLVFKEELEAIENAQEQVANFTSNNSTTVQPTTIVSKSPKKQEKKVKKLQTATVKSSDKTTKVTIKVADASRKIHPCTVIGCKFSSLLQKVIPYSCRSLLKGKRYLNNFDPFSVGISTYQKNRSDPCCSNIFPSNIP